MRIDARPLILIAALSAGPALAQEVEGVISTQTATAAPPTGLTTEQKIANILAAAPKDENAPVEPEIGPRKVHGGVEVSVGTGGYRAGYAYAVIPVGDTGTLGVAYGQSQGGRAYAGPGRRGGPRGRGDSQSLGL